MGVNRVTVAKRESGTMTITNEAVLAIQSLRMPRRAASQRTNKALSETPENEPLKPSKETDK